MAYVHGARQRQRRQDRWRGVGRRLARDCEAGREAHAIELAGGVVGGVACFVDHRNAGDRVSPGCRRRGDQFGVVGTSVREGILAVADV